jgi:hypothetical protein
MQAFISSTSKDLGEYRQAAAEVCLRLKILPLLMEHFESMGVGATAGSRAQLAAADAYVGIFANRYGYIEPPYDRSVTELEFDYAAERNLERLCFVADKTADLPTYPGDDQQKLATFKARIDTLIRSTFDSPADLKFKLYDSLVKWLFRQRSAAPLLREVFAPLFTEYARFAGRGDELAHVQAFLDAPDPGYLVITAPAGYGKTALAVQLIEARRETTAYHFFRTMYGALQEEALSETFFLKNVVDQLRLWELSFTDRWEAPTTVSGWVAAYQHLMATPLREQRVLVLDGLDEVRDWRLHPYLSSAPPANMKVIATVRDVDGTWADTYGFPAHCTSHLALGGLSRTDVAAVLRLAGPQAAALAGDSAALDRIVAVTTPAGTVAGADPLYVTFLADDIERGQVTAERINTAPSRLEEYLQTWWDGILRDAPSDSAALDLLATLAAALGPVHPDDLVALYPSLKPAMRGNPIRRIVGDMRRTLAGSDATGYSFAHPRFRDFVRRFPDIPQYRQRLLDYCGAWRQHPGQRYPLTYAIGHFAEARDFDRLFSTILDETFQAEQKNVLGSAAATVNDLRTGLLVAANEDRFIDLFACAAHCRSITQTQGLARVIFAALGQRRFDEAAAAIEAYGHGVKSSSAWVLALRCYAIWDAARLGNRQGAEMLAGRFGRELGVSYQGASLHVTELCDGLIASAIALYPVLGIQLGADSGWTAKTARALHPATADAASALLHARQRIDTLAAQSQASGGAEWNPEYEAEYLDEERAGEYMVHVRESLVALHADPEGPVLIAQALGYVLSNPYPRYRDIGLVALGLAALAMPDANWIDTQLQTILETGLEKEGVTFTFDVAAQLSAEAERRGLVNAPLADYLSRAAGAVDRWGTRLRAASATAAAAFAQGDLTTAFSRLDQAGGLAEGYAGYMSAHLLGLASRWCEFGRPAEVAARDLIERSRSQALRVRDPNFSSDRQALVDRFAVWVTELVPAWPEVSARLRSTTDPDTRRALKDLVSARWIDEGHVHNWGDLLASALNDATALDIVLGRITSRAIRRSRSGEKALSDPDLARAIGLCVDRIAVSRPWEQSAPAVL